MRSKTQKKKWAHQKSGVALVSKKESYSNPKQTKLWSQPTAMIRKAKLFWDTIGTICQKGTIASYSGDIGTETYTSDYLANNVGLLKY